MYRLPAVSGSDSRWVVPSESLPAPSSPSTAVGSPGLIRSGLSIESTSNLARWDQSRPAALVSAPAVSGSGSAGSGSPPPPERRQTSP